MWTDAAGDQEPGAPDITTVAVSDNGAGRLTIAVGIPGREQLLADEYLEVYFDTDRDSVIDYAAQLDGTAGAVKLYFYRPNGDTWQSFASSVEAAWSRQRAQVELDLREIGNPRGFNFYVRAEGAIRSGSAPWAEDRAPNRGTWNYEVSAGSAPPPPPKPKSSWTDPAGDQASWVPDITAVKVGDDGAGRITFRLDIPNVEKLRQDIIVNIGLDTDQNHAAGRQDGNRKGIEYLIVVDSDPTDAYFARWDGSDWKWFYPTTTAVEWRSGVTVTLDLAEIGNPQAFNFWAGAWGDNPDGSDRSGDVVPNTDTWNYRVGTATDGPLATGRFIIEYVLPITPMPRS